MAHYLIAEVGEDPIVHRFEADDVHLYKDGNTVSVVTTASSGYRLLLTLAEGYWSKVELVETGDKS